MRPRGSARTSIQSDEFLRLIMLLDSGTVVMMTGLLLFLSTSSKVTSCEQWPVWTKLMATTTPGLRATLSAAHVSIPCEEGKRKTELVHNPPVTFIGCGSLIYHPAVYKGKSQRGDYSHQFDTNNRERTRTWKKVSLCNREHISWRAKL